MQCIHTEKKRAQIVISLTLDYGQEWQNLDLGMTYGQSLGTKASFESNLGSLGGLGTENRVLKVLCS